jgi:hypothetical protein
MKAGQKTSRAIAIPVEDRRMRFSWTDLLVLVAALLTLAVVVDAATGHAKTAPTDRTSLITPEVSQLPNDPDLIKARIRLAIGL